VRPSQFGTRRVPNLVVLKSQVKLTKIPQIQAVAEMVASQTISVIAHKKQESGTTDEYERGIITQLLNGYFQDVNKLARENGSAKITACLFTSEQKGLYFPERTSDSEGHPP